MNSIDDDFEIFQELLEAETNEVTSSGASSSYNSANSFDYFDSIDCSTLECPNLDYVPAPAVNLFNNDSQFANCNELVDQFRLVIKSYFKTHSYMDMPDESMREALHALNSMSFELSYFIQLYHTLKINKEKQLH